LGGSGKINAELAAGVVDTEKAWMFLKRHEKVRGAEYRVGLEGQLLTIQRWDKANA
jgi:hypothetical protein